MEAKVGHQIRWITTSTLIREQLQILNELKSCKYKSTW